MTENFIFEWDEEKRTRNIVEHKKYFVKWKKCCNIARIFDVVCKSRECVDKDMRT